MKKETAHAALTLLSRVDLKGREVPTFNRIVSELGTFAFPPPPSTDDDDGEEEEEEEGMERF